MKKISESTRTISTLNVAILAAMDIANEYFEALEGQKQPAQRIERSRKSGRLIDMIDAKIH